MASGNMSSVVAVAPGGSTTETASLIPDKFRKQLEIAWKKELGHMYGENFQDETHKVIGKPNVPGMGKYETGKKKGQPRKIRFRKCRSNGKAIISRVPDSNAFGFRYMYGPDFLYGMYNPTSQSSSGFQARGPVGTQLYFRKLDIPRSCTF